MPILSLNILDNATGNSLLVPAVQRVNEPALIAHVQSLP